MASDPLVSFYSGGVDDRGRRLDEILGWSDERLESIRQRASWSSTITAKCRSTRC